MAVPARLPLALAPTPILKLDRLSRRLGVELYVHLLDGFQGEGRHGVAEEELQALVDLAAHEGVLLDPVYTAKAFRALTETLSRDAKALGQRVCFIHTGGLFSVFPFRERLSRLVDARPS